MSVLLRDAIKSVGLAASISEARRKIAEGAVRVNGAVVNDVDARLFMKRDTLIQVGKTRQKLIEVVTP